MTTAFPWSLRVPPNATASSGKKVSFSPSMCRVQIQQSHWASTMLAESSADSLTHPGASTDSWRFGVPIRLANNWKIRKTTFLPTTHGHTKTNTGRNGGRNETRKPYHYHHAAANRINRNSTERDHGLE